MGPTHPPVTSPTSRWSARLPVLIAAVIAYLPLLLTQHGWVGADTKTYLYLDPAKLLADAPWSWDAQIGMGTVTHQNIGYLFPMGPFYLLFDRLGFPDWLTQRLWLGTLMFVAALGVRFLLRTLRFTSSSGALVASLAYMLSPYLLDYAARISVILMPWVALPWLIGLTARALRRGGWRDPALIALVVLAVGGINATALLMISVGPLLWVVFAVAVEREVAARRAFATVAQIGALTLLTSLWWIGGLWAEGRYGLPVIRYTETYRAVAGASNAPEVLRGLGYWFFYGNDKLGPWVEPSVYFTTNLALLALSFGLPTAAMFFAARIRWRHRAYFLGLLVFGTLIAVAGHPWEGPSVLGGIFKEATRTNAGLSLRSTPRAVPLVALATAVFLGAGVSAIGRRVPRMAFPVTALTCVLIMANMPTLWIGQMVAENLRRPEDIPDYWVDAATWLDAQGNSTRAMEVPGIEFASYRWGNTVDPVAPGLMARPYVARELFQWGSPQSAALLNALDRRMQEGLTEPESVAPISRLLSVGHIVDRSDLQYERFRTARPKQVWDTLRRAPGLGDPVAFTAVTPNQPVPSVPLIDELELGQSPDLPDSPSVAVFPVLEPETIVRTQPAQSAMVFSGDAEGLVDGAGIGLIDNTRPVFFSASFATDPDGLRQLIDDGAHLVITDSNRKRAQRWGALRENTGYTERAGEVPQEYDPGDQRLEVFPGSTDDHRTVSVQKGNALVTSTAYGNPITYTPDDRPTNAFDGDPETAWRVGAIDDPTGEELRIDLANPITTDNIRVTQPLNLVRNRWITTVRLHFDRGSPNEAVIDAELDLSSRAEAGQRIVFQSRSFTKLAIEIVADDIGRRARYDGQSGVGFAEVMIPGVTVSEAIRPPIDLLEFPGASGGSNPLSLLFDRVRSNPSEPVRADEEPRMVRVLSLPQNRSFTLAGTARLSPWASEDGLDRLLGFPDASTGGVTVTSSAYLPSSIDQRARSAIDGDPTTWWSSIYDKQEGFWLKVDHPAPTTFDRLNLRVLNDSVHSVPTRLRIEADDQPPVVVDLPPIPDSPVRGSVADATVRFPPITGRSIRVVIDATREVKVTDWYTDRLIATPVAIAELGLPGLTSPPAAPNFDSGCRSDLLEIDGSPLPVRITGTSDDARNRRGLSVGPCEGTPARVDLGAGEHTIVTTAGRLTGLDLDRLFFDGTKSPSLPPTATPPAPTAPAPTAPAPTAPTVEVLESGRTNYRLRITGAAEPFWLTLGQSYSTGWTTTLADGTRLPQPTVVNGYANGWRMTPPAGAPPDGSFEVTVEWLPQRVIWWGVWLSAFGAVGCVALACFGRRRPELPPPARANRPPPSERVGDSTPSARATMFIGTGVGGFALLNLPASAARIPLAVALGFAATVSMRRPSARGWLGLAGAGSLGLAAAYYVLQQYRRQFPADFVWPQLFERVHVLGVLAVLLAGAEAVRELALERRPASDSPPDAPTI